MFVIKFNDKYYWSGRNTISTQFEEAVTYRTERRARRVAKVCLKRKSVIKTLSEPVSYKIVEVEVRDFTEDVNVSLLTENGRINYRLNEIKTENGYRNYIKYMPAQQAYLLNTYFLSLNPAHGILKVCIEIYYPHCNKTERIEVSKAKEMIRNPHGGEIINLWVLEAVRSYYTPKAYSVLYYMLKYFEVNKLTDEEKEYRKREEELRNIFADED